MHDARTNSSITRFMTPVLGGNSRDGGPAPRTVASKYTNTTVRPVKYSDSNNGRGHGSSDSHYNSSRVKFPLKNNIRVGSNREVHFFDEWTRCSYQKDSLYRHGRFNSCISQWNEDQESEDYGRSKMHSG